MEKFLLAFGIGSVLYSISSLLHCLSLHLEDNGKAPILRKVLSVLCIAIGFLGCPVTLIFLLIDNIKRGRRFKRHESDLRFVSGAVNASFRDLEYMKFFSRTYGKEISSRQDFDLWVLSEMRQRNLDESLYSPLR